MEADETLPGAEDSANRLFFRVDPADEGSRLDQFLGRRMPWRSRTSIQELVRQGRVRVFRRARELRARRPAAPVVAGDEVAVVLPPSRRAEDLEGADFDLRILHEDRWLLAVDKPAGVAVHPAGRNLAGTVIERLRAGAPGVPFKLCHRLDLETSGVLLVAKDEQVHREVQRLFRERVPRKDYLAVVFGAPDPPEGLVDLPIGPKLGRVVAIMKGVRHDVGQEARTRYRVLRAAGRFSLVRLELLTGRHHQIRVHMAAIGHPLVGDKLYAGGEEVFLRYYEGRLTEEDRRRLVLPRQALHAHRLALPHPVTGEPLVVESPLPGDLAALLGESEN